MKTGVDYFMRMTMDELRDIGNEVAEIGRKNDRIRPGTKHRGKNR